MSSIEYSNTRTIPEVAINYRMIQNIRMLDSLLKFVVEQLFEISQNNQSQATLRPTCNIYYGMKAQSQTRI